MRHEKRLKSLARPDFIFVEKTAPKNINPIYASFVVELLFNNETIDNKHIGKVIYYNQEILICNPTREFIISAVSNLHDIMFIKTVAIKQKKKTRSLPILSYTYHSQLLGNRIQIPQTADRKPRSSWLHSSI